MVFFEASTLWYLTVRSVRVFTSDAEQGGRDSYVFERGGSSFYFFFFYRRVACLVVLVVSDRRSPFGSVDLFMSVGLCFIPMYDVTLLSALLSMACAFMPSSDGALDFAFFVYGGVFVELRTGTRGGVFGGYFSSLWLGLFGDVIGV